MTKDWYIGSISNTSGNIIGIRVYAENRLDAANKIKDYIMENLTVREVNECYL